MGMGLHSCGLRPQRSSAIKNVNYITPRNVSLGRLWSHWLLLNHIIIVGKQLIYHNRVKNSLPSLSRVITKLNYIESIERSIATKNNRLKTHNGKWKPFINAFQHNL